MEKGEKVKWYLRPLGVVLLLFFVLGPFGLTSSSSFTAKNLTISFSLCSINGNTSR